MMFQFLDDEDDRDDALDSCCLYCGDDEDHTEDCPLYFPYDLEVELEDDGTAQER